MRLRACPDVEATIRACYSAGADLSEFRQRFLARLRRAVPVDAVFFAACDPDTLLFTSAWAEIPLATSAPRFLDNEFGDEADVNRFASLARAHRPLATLDQATEGKRTRSRRYCEIIAPLGLGDELRVALRVGQTTWGFLCLHREPRASFSERDVAILERVAPHGAQAIRRAVLDRTTASVAAEPATILVEHGTVVGVTPVATTLLGERLAVGDALPLPLLALVRRLDTVERTGAVASVTMPGRQGAVEVHAASIDRADGSQTVALTVTGASSAARCSLLLSAHGLTPAQKRVTALVVRGLSTRQIVRTLRVSEHTVQDHLKVVFDKMGVSTRRELVAALMG